MGLAEYSDSTVAWAVYAVCALACFIATWRFSSIFSWSLIRHILRILVAVILVTPAYTSQDMVSMAPAFAVWGMELLAQNHAGVMRAVKPLVFLSGLGVSIAVIVSIVGAVRHRKNGDRHDEGDDRYDEGDDDHYDNDRYDDSEENYRYDDDKESDRYDDNNPVNIGPAIR